MPYFSDSHIDLIKFADRAYKLQHSSANKKLVNVESQDRAEGSPFTCVCAYVRLDQGSTGELQMIGPRVVEIANAEHLPYDALIHKDIYRRLNAEGKEKMRPFFEPFLKAVQGLSTYSQRREYEIKLNNCYIHARKVEKQIAAPGEDIPFPPTLKAVPELRMENILRMEKEYEEVLATHKR